jgi:hypothetical protein
MPQASIQAKVPANCVPGVQAWIPLIGCLGNTQVSGSKGREHLSVEGDNGGWDGTAIGWWFETEPLAIDFNDS